VSEQTLEASQLAGQHGDYNYNRFDASAANVTPGVTAGEKAVDVTLHTLDGEPVQVADLYAERPAVIEFGSITCPIFTSKTERMDRLADAYADEVDFYVVYTREAHPGLNYPAHQTLDEKRGRAAAACRTESIDRTMLVDDVDGRMHRLYVPLPNSVYLIGTDGIVAHRADWLDPDLLESEIDTLLAQGGAGADVTPTDLSLNYDQPSREHLSEFRRVFRRAGPGSFRDFVRAFPRLLFHRLTHQRIKPALRSLVSG